MENHAIMFKSICRLCLSSENSDNFVSLIQTDKENGISCYGESVKRFAQVSIEKDDELPKHMCQKCLFLLKCAIYFKFRCEKSELILKKWAREHVNNGYKQTNSAEVNYQYNLFKQYFPDQNHENPTYDSSNFEKPLTENDNSNDTIFSDSILPDENYVAQTDNKSKIFKRHLTILPKNTATPKKYIPTRNRLKRRQKISKKDKYECEICKKVLANPVTFSNHMEYHSGCRFICEHCGKGFPVIARLQIHQVAVHNSGPGLPCQYCSYRAPTRPKLTEHERLHTGERPFTCDKCGLTFRRRAIWKKHMIHHTEKTVQCPLCPRKFFTVQDLKVHSNNIHERRYMYICHKCNTTYAKSETVRKHLTEVHGIPREMQGKITRINWGKHNNTVEP